MGNTSSAPAKSNSVSPASSTHGSLVSGHGQPQSVASPAEKRREPKLRDNIQAQRGPAPPESSRIQAQGTTTSHRTRNSFSQQTNPQYGYGAQSGSPRQQGQQSHSPRVQSPPQTNQYREFPEARRQQHSTVPIPAQQTGPQPRDEPTQPVAVPQQQPPRETPIYAERPGLQQYSSSQTNASDILADTMSYHLTRPPRLPLPIEEEVHTPGSPILGPADTAAPVPDIDPLESTGEGISRPLSALSNTTEDEDVEGALPIDKSKPTVPTEFVWNGGGEKVYVTGTIFDWSKKTKLYPIQGQPGHFRTVIGVRPGTHHIRFIVDGVMLISPDLPTTVDFGNNLVNYIEVSADDLPKDTSDLSTGATENQRAPASEPGDGTHEETPSDQPVVAPVRKKIVRPDTHYTNVIPQYLIDLDAPEDSPKYQNVARAIGSLPAPPSLPGFLGKPILNAVTPMKDDNSVLTMPNHTVLNHLATSSIKGNVLAVSATTRYKKKYVTTIMYKPTSDDIN